MSTVAQSYYEILCKAVEEVAEEFEGMRGAVLYIPIDIKDRLINAAISILETTEVEVSVEGDKG